ncbi:hypothetical protein ACFU5O_04775 [Streptomyces sp. NPDC057445]|uniref:hypothetical protein n=1 Tax=Streptomyces sp. NPDC057445 TaxID=3346136 RepID=UPI0036A48B48
MGRTHEPNEVTVQLDGLGRQLSELRDGPTPQDSSDGPVFVDASGRRSKKLRRVGWVLAIACACYAITLVVALAGGNSKAPWLLIPGPEDEKNTSTVQEQPAATDSPADPVAPGGTPGAPAPTDSTGAVIPQQPDGTSGGPRTSGRPSAPAAPGPSTGPSDGGPDAGADGGAEGGLPDPGPSVPVPPGGGPGGQEPPPASPDPTDTATTPTEEPPTDPAAGEGGQQAAEGAQ